MLSAVLTRSSFVLAQLVGVLLAGVTVGQAPIRNGIAKPPLAPQSVAAAISVDAASVQALALPPGLGDSAQPTHLRIPIVLGDHACALDLLPADVRAPGYQCFARTASGLVPLPPAPTVTFRGVVVGEPDSRVAATIHDGCMHALVVRPKGDSFAIQPQIDGFSGTGFGGTSFDGVELPARPHLVYRAADARAAIAHCGVVQDQLLAATAAVGEPDSTLAAQLAIEADHPLFLLNNSDPMATQTEVLGIVNAVDAIFQGELQLTFTVTQVIVDVAPDPYVSNVASLLLAEVRSYWNNNYGGVTRDVMHLFSGRQIGFASSGTVGYAYVGTVCTTANAYGLSELRWSANYALRVALTAHELGHNFGATHCDTLPGCDLMCSLIGGCGGVAAGFGPQASSQIQGYLQGVGCLTLLPTVPVVASANPSQVATVDPAQVTLQGSGFLAANYVSVDGIPVSNGIQIVSDTQLRFSPPHGLTLGPKQTSVTTPAGTSNAIAIDYTGADPAQVVVPAVVPPGQSMFWVMGGWPNDTGYLGYAFDNTTTTFLGESVLSNFSLLWSGQLDARGMASLQLSVPSVLQGFTLYSQLLDEPAGTATLRSVSEPRSTRFL